jgi:hypothetical protein
MRRKALLVLALVALWTLLGSAALAFAHCATMAAPCAGPCVLTAIVLEVPVSEPVSAPPVIIEAPSGPSLAALALPGPDPVPRPFRPSA